MISIKIKDRSVQALLHRMAERTENMLPAMQDIGEALSEGTKQRFAESRDWEGKAWTANAPSTVTRYLSCSKGNYKKNGTLSARGTKRAAAKKPLVGESKSLSTTINYHASRTEVSIGSPMEYAATQHFGARRGAFGSSQKGPIPWGDIPARPFLPMTDDGTLPTAAARMVHEILTAYLMS